MTDAEACPLGPLSKLSPPQLQEWLRGALQGRECLPRIVPDELPHLVVARCEYDPKTRRDLRHALIRLVVAFTRDDSAVDPDYVVALTGLVREFDLQDAAAALARWVQTARFESHPVRVQSRVLSTLIDMRFPLAGEFWNDQVQLERHQALALQALLFEGLDGLKVLTHMGSDEGVADAVYMVLSEHGRRLDVEHRERMVARVAELVADCAGPIKGVLKEWAAEHGAPESLEEPHVVL